MLKPSSLHRTFYYRTEHTKRKVLHEARDCRTLRHHSLIALTRQEARDLAEQGWRLCLSCFRLS